MKLKKFNFMIQSIMALAFGLASTPLFSCEVHDAEKIKLKTKNTLLRPFQNSDFEPLVSLFFAEVNPEMTSEADLKWLSFMKYLTDTEFSPTSNPTTHAEKKINFAIVQKENDQLIGFLQIFSAETLSLVASLKASQANLLGSKHWASLGYSMQRGPYEAGELMPEVLQKITQFGFSHLDINCFYVNIAAEHSLSKNALEASGFEYLGKTLGQHPITSETIEDHYYRLVKSGYAECPDFRQNLR